jgi:hypothetical protein
MRVVLKNEYSIQVPKVFVTEVEVNIEEWLKDYVFNDEGDLRYRLEDLIWDIEYECFAEGDTDIENDDLETFIENMDELVEKYSYLIVPEPEQSCCEKASQGSNFCNTCGKKLN